MYFTAILIDDDKLSSTELLVWYTLCSFARWKYQDKKPKLADNVFPSYDKIAERAHLARSTTAKALKHLQELGYIEIISGGNDGRSNRYILSIKETGASGKETEASGKRTVTITPNRTINKGKFINKEKLKRDEELRREREADPEAWERFMADIRERVSRH